MAKEIPFFRFTVSEWMNGDISMADYKAKGLFADICAWYWFKDCSVTKAMLEQRYTDSESLTQLFQLEVIKPGDDGMIHIEFLDEQFEILFNLHEARKAAGSKGGKQRSSNAKARLKQSSSYKYKYKDNDKYKEGDKKEKSIKEKSQCLMSNSGVTVDDVSEAFLKTKDLTQADPEYYFNQVLDWSSNRGKMGKDWLAAIRSWARRDLNDGKLKVLPYRHKRLT